jgi:hypothetical protein
MGTDALKLDTFPPGKWYWSIRIVIERILFKLIEPLFSEHWIVHERLRKHLLNFGISNRKIKVVIDPPLYPEPFPKEEHAGFNILFYYAIGSDRIFTTWKYGYDIFEQVMAYPFGFPINWIIVNVGQDMGKIYPVVDCYVRPSRHDGEPRMVLECKINKIPYYYSEDGNPKVEDIIKFIEEQYAVKTKTN